MYDCNVRVLTTLRSVVFEIPVGTVRAEIVCMYICMYVCMCRHGMNIEYVHKRMYVRMYVRMYACMYVCTNIPLN